MFSKLTNIIISFNKKQEHPNDSPAK